MKNFGHKKFLLVFVMGIFLVGAGCGQTKKPSPDTKPVEEIETSRDVTLQGTWVCLPHQVAGSEVAKMECAYGFKTDEGKHYALDLSAITLPADFIGSLQVGDRVTVSGLLVPIEQISNNIWQKYDVRGIIKVTSLQK